MNEILGAAVTHKFCLHKSFIKTESLKNIKTKIYEDFFISLATKILFVTSEVYFWIIRVKSKHLMFQLSFFGLFVICKNENVNSMFSNALNSCEIDRWVDK